MATNLRDYSDKESDNWNIARLYSTNMIHDWLIKIDMYQTISVFGFTRLENDIFNNDNNMKNLSRINAMKRLVHAMMSLIRNTKFAILKNDKSSFDEHLDRLKKIEKNIDRLRIEKRRGNSVTELNIDEELFDKINTELTTMIDDINTKLNNADLIFTHIDEIDMTKIKDSIKDRYVNRT